MDQYLVYGYTFSGEKKLLGAFAYEDSATEEAQIYSNNKGYATVYVTGPKGFYKTFHNSGSSKINGFGLV